MTDRRWRGWAAAIAAAGWSGLILQVILSTFYWGSWEAAVWRLSIFFTILSNLTTAIVFTLIAFGSTKLRHPRLMAGLALTMALVGAVFELMLRRIVHPTGWRLVTNALLHDAVPLLTMAAWFLLAEKGQLRARDPWLIAIFPIVYLGYALLRGATGGFYPYPFIDPGRVGWLGVTGYVLAISAAFLTFAYLMVLLDGYLSRRSRQRQPRSSARSSGQGRYRRWRGCARDHRARRAGTPVREARPPCPARDRRSSPPQHPLPAAR